MKRAWPLPTTPSPRVAFLLIALALALAFNASADIIYRETFGIPPGAAADATAKAFDWQRFDANGLATNGLAVNFSAVGRLADVSNVNAGPNSDGSFGAYTNGIFYMGSTPSPSLGLTTEFSFDPANYISNSVVFSWYEGNNTAAHLFRFIIRQAGRWYAGTATFSTPAVSLTGFGTGAQLKSLIYNPTATNWVLLNFDGGYTLGASPGTGTGTNSTLGAITLGSVPANDLSGPITGFGVYGENGGTGTGNRRIDTFTIDATPASSGGTPAAFNQSASTLVNTPLSIALGGSDPAGDPLTFLIVANPANGALGTLNSNLVTYTPNEGFVGSDAFTFQVTDGQATSAVATVSLAVTNLEIPFPSGPQITNNGTTVLVLDYARLPGSGRGGGLTNFGPNVDLSNQLARVSFLRAEPTNAPLSATRFFLCDNNRMLYILDRATTNFTGYINFQSIFPKFDNDPGYAGGVVSFAFDPAYATNGKFYTVHTEDPAIAGSAVPINTNIPGFDTNGYTVTTVINPPGGSVPRQSVLIEWTDTNLDNETFEGSARELLRVGFNNNAHPMGDLLFNPLARPGDWDYGNLYIANGDGASGESSSTRTTPQRLDALQGKILRITPDTGLRTADELSANGRYRIPTTGPDPNPFISVSLANLKKEIFAFGFRNCHRLAWDPIANVMTENDIGLHSWEEVNIIHKGADYGYSEREGTEQLFVGGSNNGKTGSQISPPVAFPVNDTLTVTGLVSSVTPVYPVAQYSHEDGDAIASGFVYRGSLMPQLYGKYIFGEITTGRLLYCDLAEMLAKDDGVRTSVANVLELKLVFNGNKRRLFDVISNEYHARGGLVANALPGSALATAANDIDGIPYGRGRADIRLGIDNDGELYVLSKSDGMIRRLTAVLVPPTLQPVVRSNTTATVTWTAISNEVYRVQFKDHLSDSNWADLPGDVTASGLKASKTDTSGVATRFYRVFMP